MPELGPHVSPRIDFRQIRKVLATRPTLSPLLSIHPPLRHVARRTKADSALAAIPVWYMVAKIGNSRTADILQHLLPETARQMGSFIPWQVQRRCLQTGVCGFPADYRV